MTETVEAVDLFAGPGGWDVAAGELGVVTIGIERDASACATRAAAGHLTIRADVTQYPPERFKGIGGVIGSPPCPTFSTAGKGSGAAELMHLVACIAAGAWCDPWGFHQWEDPRTPLVLVPLRWVDIIRPRWVALEQVPPVLPVWEAMAVVLRSWGYSVWTGKLNAADYGVPQTRKRAFLGASRVRHVSPPEPTHARRPVPSLFGTRALWITMADALGWGMTARPMTTVTTGGAATGGVDAMCVGGSGARRTIEREREREDGSWLEPAATPVEAATSSMAAKDHPAP